MNFLESKKILLIICGGIAAYKSLELIRILKKKGCLVKTVLTNNAKNFVTPLHQQTKRNYNERMMDDKVNCTSIAKKYDKEYCR